MHAALLIGVCLFGELPCSPYQHKTCPFAPNTAFGDGLRRLSRGEADDLTEEQHHELCHPENWQRYEECLSACPVSLHITEPEELRARLCVSDSNFQPYVPAAHITEGHPLQGATLQLVAVGNSSTNPDRMGCSPASFSGKDFRGKLAVFRRGSCYFETKMRQASAAGAAAALIVNSASSNYVLDQIIIMGGSSIGIGNTPGVFAPAHYGDIILSALDSGKRVEGHITMSCPADPLPLSSSHVTDTCPNAHLLSGVCEDAEEDEDALCMACPLTAVFTPEVTACLYGNDLLPRSAKNFLQHTRAVPGHIDVLIPGRPLPQEGCDVSSYASIPLSARDNVFILPEPQQCLLAAAARAAEAAGASGVIFAPSLTRTTPVFPSGTSSYVGVPVHTILPVEAAAVLSLGERNGGSPTVLRVFLHKNATRPHPDDHHHEDDERIATPLRREYSADFVPLAFIPIGLLLPAIAWKLWVQRRLIKQLTQASGDTCDTMSQGTTAPLAGGDAMGEPRKWKPRISLATASLLLAGVLLACVGGVSFALSSSASMVALDDLRKESEIAITASFEASSENILGMAQHHRVSIVHQMTDSVSRVLFEGLTFSRIASRMMESYDGSWYSFQRLTRPLSLITGVSDWVVSVLSTEGFYARYTATLLTTTDSRMESVTGKAGISQTTNGSLYGFSQFSPPFKAANYLGTTPRSVWLPEECIGGGRGDPIGMTSGLAREAHIWVPTEETYFRLTDSPRLPLSILSPVIGNGVFRGTLEVTLDSHRLDDILAQNIQAFLDHTHHGSHQEFHGNPVTAVLYDIPTRSILATNSYRAINYPYQLQVRGFVRGVMRVYTLDNLPVPEVMALGRVLTQEDAPHTITINLDDFRYTERHHVARLVAPLGSGLLPQSDDDNGGVPTPFSSEGTAVEDASGNRYHAVVRDGVGGAVVDLGYDISLQKRVIRFGGGSVLHVYQNLTTDLPIVKEAMAYSGGGLASRVMESRKFLFGFTMPVPGTSQVCSTGIPAGRLVYTSPSCMLREPFYLNSFTVSATFKSDVLIPPELDMSSTPQLFSTTFAGDAIVRLFANGQLYVGFYEFGCRTPPVASGIPAGKWTTLTASVDRNQHTCTVYLNGVVEAETHSAEGFFDKKHLDLMASPLYIGKHFKGSLLEASFFNISMAADEVARYVNTGVFEPELKGTYFADRSELPQPHGEATGCNWGVAVLIERSVLLHTAEENNEATLMTLRHNEEYHIQKRDSQLKFYSAVVITLILASVLVFLIFNQRLTQPFAVFAQAMSDAALMQIKGIPTQHSAITELDLMYRSMGRMLENLEAYRPFLPDALFENMQWVGQCRAHRGGRHCPGLKTGYCAILFTDIEGSTQLWDTAPEAMKVALRTHNSVMRNAIEKHHGYEVKTVGDSFMVAFDTATDAAAFGLDVQLGLHRHPWAPELAMKGHAAGDNADPAGIGICARIGVNFGEVDIDFNHITGRYDYFGSTVNKASRLESLGPGGAVALSEDVLEEVISDLPDSHDITFSNLQVGTEHALCLPVGRVRLKGIMGSVHMNVLVPLALSAKVGVMKAYLSTLEVEGEGDSDSGTSDTSMLNPLVRSISLTSSRSSGSTAFRRVGIPCMKRSNAAMVRTSYNSQARDDTQDTVSMRNDVVSKIVQCLERSEGVVQSVFSTSVIGSWNTVRSVTSAYSASCRYMRLINAAEVRGSYTSGISHGSVWFSNVGTATQKFISVSGTCVDLCESLWKSARLLGCQCLQAWMANVQPKLSGTQRARRSRPVDIWHIEGHDITVVEAKPEVSLAAINEYTAFSMGLKDGALEWGWTEGYVEAFHQKDYSKINAHSECDAVLAKVALVMRRGETLLTSPFAGLEAETQHRAEITTPLRAETTHSSSL